MSYRAGVGPQLAVMLGVEPGGPRVKCDGCGAVVHVRDDRPPPNWLLDGKPPKGWSSKKNEDGTRHDLCGQCRPTQKRVRP